MKLAFTIPLDETCREIQMSTEETLFWVGVGFVLATVGHAIYRFIKHKVREHERIVNEKILMGIK